MPGLEQEVTTMRQAVYDWLSAKVEQLNAYKQRAIAVNRLEQSEYSRNQLAYAKHALACAKWLRSQVPIRWNDSLVFRSIIGESSLSVPNVNRLD